MTVKKKTVADAVSSATKKATKPAKSVSTKVAVVEVTNWDKELINSNTSEDTKADGKRYTFYLGKDRLIRTADGWGSAEGKLVEFVIFGADEKGNPLKDLPKAKFGSAQDVDYYQSKYPLQKGFYVNDSLCSNGRHRITIYKIHIINVVDKVEVA